MSALTPPLRLVADDLSGALDTLVQLRLPGLDWPALTVWDRPTPGAVALSTGTRDTTEDVARARVAQVAPWLAAAGLSYKKLDSRLRGPVAAELAALVAGDPGRCIVVAPSLPRQGRVVRTGKVTTHGEVEPVDLRAELARFGLACRPARPGDSLPPGISLWDAASEAHLDRIAATAMLADQPVIFCGSAGLAGAVRRAAGGTPPGRVGIAAPVLMLIGTDHPATRRQVAGMAEARTHPVLRVDADGTGREAVADCLAAGRSCAATVALAPQSDRAAAAMAIEAAIAGLLGRVPRPGTLFATGGTTLLGVAQRLGADGLRVSGQVEAGTPAGFLVGGRWDGLAVVSKSGGFGDAGSLRRLLDDAR